MNFGVMSGIKRIIDGHGHAVERNSGVAIAWHNGRRTDESCSRLMEKISVFPAARFYTDGWKSCQEIYSSYLSCDLYHCFFNAAGGDEQKHLQLKASRRDHAECRFNAFSDKFNLNK